MKRIGGVVGIVGGAIAGGLIALVVASGSTTSHSSVTTTVVQPARAVPTSVSTGHGMTVNQIYRSASPGVVDITVTSISNSGGFPFGGSQETQGEGAGVV